MTSPPRDPRPGHVEPGGPPLVVELSPTLTLAKISVGSMDNNAYLLSTPEVSMLVDAADEDDRILGLVAGRTVETIVTTHRHGDHWQALPAVARATDAALVCGRPDLDAIATGAWLENLTGVWDGDQVALGSETFAVIGLVGHTPGSIALAWTGASGAHLFTGDSLFPGGPGRTRTPQDFGTLMADLEGKIFARFDDATVVHPGHGDDTTLGAERPQLAGWRARGW